jgi:hypothetical protein
MAPSSGGSSSLDLSCLLLVVPLPLTATARVKLEGRHWVITWVCPDGSSLTWWPPDLGPTPPSLALACPAGVSSTFRIRRQLIVQGWFTDSSLGGTRIYGGDLNPVPSWSSWCPLFMLQLTRCPLCAPRSPSGWSLQYVSTHPSSPHPLCHLDHRCISHLYHSALSPRWKMNTFH